MWYGRDACVLMGDVWMYGWCVDGRVVCGWTGGVCGCVDGRVVCGLKGGVCGNVKEGRL